MKTSHEVVSVRIAMENHWKGSNKESLVFYKDMRFWLILLMLAAFFAFTLMRFP